MYHCHIKPITRGRQQSAVASAAYRSAEKLFDERVGLTFDYTRKEHVEETRIFGWKGSRSDLWNSAEKAEKRKDSLVAREVEINLPHISENPIGVAYELSEWISKKYKVAVDCAIHVNQAQTSIHAHLMLTGRQVENGIFAPKKDRGWDANPGRERTNEIRVKYSEICKKHVPESERPNWDFRSYKDRGLDITPQRKASRARLKRNPNMREEDRELQRIEREIIEKEKQLQEAKERSRASESLQIVPEIKDSDFDLGDIFEDEKKPEIQRVIEPPKKVPKKRRGRRI